MDDYTSRRAAIVALLHRKCGNDEYDIAVQDCIETLKQLTSADVKPVVYGKWVFIGDNMFECSNCCTPYTKEQLLTWKRFKYDSDFPNCCPNCGSVNKGATSYG